MSSINKIKVSIIIPTYNEKEKLINCINSIYNQSYPNNLIEVIVIDDGSTDGTKNYLKYNFKKVLLIEKQNTGAYDSRNRGINIATGDILAFTDSDCVADKNWINNIVKNIKDSKNIIAGGKIVHKNNFIQKVIGISDFGEYQDDKIKNINAIPTANLAASKIIFDKYRFDQSLKSSGDRLFSWKLFKDGFKLIYFPDIIIFHDPSIKLSRFFERKYRYGKSFIEIRKNHPDLPGSKIVKYHILGAYLISILRTILDIFRLFKTLKNNNIKIYEIVPAIVLIGLGRITFLCGNIVQLIKND